MVGSASLASVQKQLCDRVLAGTRQPRDRADGIAFAQKVDDPGAIFGAELVHEIILGNLLPQVKHKGQFGYSYQFRLKEQNPT